MTGFGRIGGSTLWDLLVTAKGITSGYVPLGATMLCDEVADTLHRGGYLARIGPYVQDKLRAFGGRPAVGEIRGTGLMGRLWD